METIRGLLEVYIGEATGLPDTDSSWFSSSKDTTDAYVKVQPHLLFIVTNHLFWGLNFKLQCQFYNCIYRLSWTELSWWRPKLLKTGNLISSKVKTMLCPLVL